MLDNVLVLAPHRDDEVLGLGGTLFRCHQVHIHYFNNVHPLVEQTVYDTEAAAVANALGCTVTYSQHMQVNHLEDYSTTCFITEIEDLINQHKPDTLFIPASSYNQDHRTVFDAAITAIRVHDTNWYVPNVLLYEQPETLTPYRVEPHFVPHLFVPIDIEKKLALWEIYQSQHRGHRSADHLRFLAGVRGMQCHTEYAESFMSIRMTYD